MLAKTTRPNTAAVYPRPRLFRLLDRRGPVVWVYGPAGSGKTALVASYLARRRLTGLWYQLDENDDDVAAFFYYLGQGARRTARGGRQSLTLLKPEYWPTLDAFSRRYFRQLYGRLRPPFAVVLDNHHEVSERSVCTRCCVTPLRSCPAGPS